MQLRTLAMILPLTVVSSISHAAGLTVGFRDPVKPDAELQAFVTDLKRLHVAPKMLDYKAIDAMFAPRVKAFTRGLDPFQAWHKLDDITSNYLAGAADIMVEQGELPEGAKRPDYRLDALKLIIEQVAKGDPFGTQKEAPGAVCAPAEYKVNRKAASKFAKKYELDAYSLRFYSQPVALYEKQTMKGELLGMIPPYTLMMFDYDPKAREPWALYESSSGIKGYLYDDQPALGLAQHHVCFGKVGGRYRITALFGYGL